MCSLRAGAAVPNLLYSKVQWTGHFGLGVRRPGFFSWLSYWVTWANHLTFLCFSFIVVTLQPQTDGGSLWSLYKYSRENLCLWRIYNLKEVAFLCSGSVPLGWCKHQAILKAALCISKYGGSLVKKASLGPSVSMNYNQNCTAWAVAE